MKVAALSLLFASGASAFTSQQSVSSRTTTALNAGDTVDWDTQFGVGPETGNKVPIYGKMIEVDETGVKWFQNAELKHGRAAMLATLGYLSQKYGMHFPLYLGPSGSNAFSPESTDAWYLSSSSGVTFSDLAHAATPFDAIGMIPPAGWVQMLVAAGAFELTALNRQWNEDRPIPGDYGYDPLGFTKDAGIASKEFESLRMKELKNGRLAMMTMAGWLSEESIPGSFPLWHP